MKQYITLILIIIGIMASAAGCRGENKATENNRKNSMTTQQKDGDSGQKTIEPCQLITKADAEEIMDEVMKEGAYREQKAVGSKTCLYEAVNEDSSGLLQISITQTSFMTKEFLASGQSPKTLFDAIKENFSESRIDIEGIGEEAFFATPGLHISYGDVYIVIAAGHLERNKERLNIAGKNAIEKLIQIQRKS